MIYRHGDVMLIQTNLPTTAERLPMRRLVLATGDSSAHIHTIAGAQVTEYTHGQHRFVSVAGPARIVVEHDGADEAPRHAPINIPTGTYEVRIQRAYDAATAASHRVED